MNKLLSFVYKSRLLRLILIRPFVSKVAGIIADSRFSKVFIKSFIKKHSINMDEALTTDFNSFNDFFIRKIKPRELGRGFISPSDSKLFVIPDVSQADTLFIKSNKFSLEEFLGDKQLAEDFYGCMVLIFRLSPEDYHRFHFPIDCRPSVPRVINGLYDSVNTLVYASGYQPLLTNERHLIKLDDNTIMIPVGALCVGRITETYTSEEQYMKGDEVGYFSFGGSTVVVLSKGIKVLDKYLSGKEVQVKMGESLTPP